MNRVIAVCLFVLLPFSSAKAQSLMIDDFESGLRISCATETGGNKYLFNHYDGYVAGSEEVTTEDAHSGSYSAKETITETGGTSYFQLRPVTCSGAKDYTRAHVLTPSSWQLDTYNRMRFWIKLPPGKTKAGGGNDNFHFATYTRRTTQVTSDYESDGGHWYHHYNLKSTGEWQQVIVDWHPNSKRGIAGATEHGEKQYPTSEAGYNYFDLLTRWYVQSFGDDYVGRPVYLDDFELYRETRTENVDQVYSVSAVYVPSTNEIDVTWQRDKDENSTVHEVRYSFSDIHSQGFANANFAANVTPLGWQGYNGMEWTSTAVDVSGQSSIFVAIKPTDSALFRQIEIPLTASEQTHVVHPMPGTDWVIIHDGPTVLCSSRRATPCELPVNTIYSVLRLPQTGKMGRKYMACKAIGCTEFAKRSGALAHLQ